MIIYLIKLNNLHTDTKAMPADLFAPLEVVYKAYTTIYVGVFMPAFITMPFLCPKFSDKFNASNLTHLSEAKKLYAYLLLFLGNFPCNIIIRDHLQTIQHGNLIRFRRFCLKLRLGKKISPLFTCFSCRYHNLYIVYFSSCF